MTNYYDRIIDRIKGLGTVEYVGSTELGYAIPLVKVGVGKPSALIIAGVHAREYVTVDLCLRMVSSAPKGLCFHYLPILNIDGTLLVKEGLKIVQSPQKREFLRKINGGDDFRNWKANARGVDINTNFDADWGEGQYNLTHPAPANFIGLTAGSEAETRCVTALLKKYDYPLIACYHSLGEEIYWGYEANYRHYEEAKAVAADLGYKLKRSENSCGGIKDYYALNYDGLGLTIEVGDERYGHPYPEDKMDELYYTHRNSLALLARTGDKIAERIYERSVSGGKACVR